MADWPRAPRLEAEFERRADEVDIDPHAKADTTRLLAQQNVGSVTRVRSDRSGDDERTPGRRSPMVLLAATVVIVAGLAAITTWQRDGTESVVATRDGTESVVATDVPDSVGAFVTPGLDVEAICRELRVDLAGRRVDVGGSEIEVGVSRTRLAPDGLPDAGAPEEPTGLVVSAGPSPDWRDQAERDGLSRQSQVPATLYYVPDIAVSADTANALVDGLLRSPCSIPNVLVVTGSSTIGTTVACPRSGGVGWWGYVFVDGAAPPADCQLRQPTVVVDADAALWEEHFGCAGPTGTSTGPGGVITTYDSCQVRLVHVTTTSPDPWLATVDGLPLGTFALNQLLSPGQ